MVVSLFEVLVVLMYSSLHWLLRLTLSFFPFFVLISRDYGNGNVNDNYTTMKIISYNKSNRVLLVLVDIIFINEL